MNQEIQNARRYLRKIQSIATENDELKERASSLLLASSECVDIPKFLADVNAFNAWIYVEVGSGIGM